MHNKGDEAEFKVLFAASGVSELEAIAMKLESIRRCLINVIGLRNIGFFCASLTLFASTLLLYPSFAYSEGRVPELTFEPNALQRTSIHVSCGMVGSNCKRGNERDPTDIDPDSTPILQEKVFANDGGEYYHVLIGDPSSGFSMEYYIHFSGAYGSFENGDADSASGGVLNGGLEATPENKPYVFVSPLAPFSESGNGTGSPVRVIFRQTVSDGRFSQEVHKSAFASKPQITQSLSDDELNSLFQVDMTNSDYYTMDTTGQFINTMSITDVDGKKVADFDQNDVLNMIDVNTGEQWNRFQNVNAQGLTGVNAGRYIKVGGEGVDEIISRYVNRYGWSYEDAWRFAGERVSGQIGDRGGYVYEEGDFNLKGIDWEAFWDPSQNVPNE